MQINLSRWPEIWITGIFAVLVLVLSAAHGLPILFPKTDSLSLVGMHYIYPLLGVTAWGLFVFFGLRRRIGEVLLISLPCYAMMLLLHFNLKLWRPMVNPTEWDWLYWMMDQTLRPLVDACIALREAIAWLVPLDSPAYLWAFIAMFYASFSIHALRSVEVFRKVFLAALIFQGAGAIGYLLIPALGPFLYEPGVEPGATHIQQGMLQIYRDLVAGGNGWLREHGSQHLVAGLGAMPSLHVGGAFLFLCLARRYERWLATLYLPLFAFITIDAIATRWHYLIDLPVGIGIAMASIWAAERLVEQQGQAGTSTPESPEALPAPVPTA